MHTVLRAGYSRHATAAVETLTHEDMEEIREMIDQVISSRLSEIRNKEGSHSGRAQPATPPVKSPAAIADEKVKRREAVMKELSRRR